MQWRRVGVAVALGVCGALLVVWGINAQSSLLTGLQAYWPLDEQSGTRYDAHNAHHLTDNNTVGYETGVLTNAASLDATNYEYLSVPGFGYTNTSFSLSTWFKLDTLGGWQPIIDKESIFELGVTGDDLNFAFHKSDSLTVTDAILIGTWYHAAATYDASTGAMNLYLNGASASGSHDNTEVFSDTGPLRLGNDDGSAYLDGAIDEVGIWSRALSYSEIQQLYNSGAGFAYPLGGGGASPPPVTYSNTLYFPYIQGGEFFDPLPPVPTPQPTPENPYDMVDPIDFSGDTTWWEWAMRVNEIVSPIHIALHEIAQSIASIEGELCDVDLGMFLIGDNYEELIELQLGDDPSVQKIAYSLGFALGRPVGWIRSAIQFTQDIGAWYLTALLYFLLAGIAWIAFVAIVMYSLHFARWALEIIVQLYELIPFKAT